MAEHRVMRDVQLEQQIGEESMKEVQVASGGRAQEVEGCEGEVEEDWEQSHMQAGVVRVLQGDSKEGPHRGAAGGAEVGIEERGQSEREVR